MIKGKDLRQAENRLTILPLVVAQQEGELDGCSREFVEITRGPFVSVKTIVSGGNRGQLAGTSLYTCLELYRNTEI